MIQSFRDHATDGLFRREAPRKFAGCAEAAYRKMVQIDRATALADLAAIPGNRLEKLGRDRKGRYSIRVNDPYRGCFRWEGTKAFEVEVVDYHESNF